MSGEATTTHRFVGQHVTFDSNRRSYKGGATVTAVRYPPCTITTGEGLFRGIEFRLKPDGGGRAFWTTAMPDPDGPVLAGGSGGVSVPCRVLAGRGHETFYLRGCDESF